MFQKKNNANIITEPYLSQLKDTLRALTQVKTQKAANLLGKRWEGALHRGSRSWKKQRGARIYIQMADQALAICLFLVVEKNTFLNGVSKEIEIEFLLQ